MEPEEQPQNRKERVMILSIGSLALIVVAVVAIIIFARGRVDKARTTIQPTGGRTGDQKESIISGKVGLAPKGDATSFRKGQSVTLFVYADSRGQEITGYDVVLRYDTTKVRFESVKSVLEGMDIYETEGEVAPNTSELIVTGVQSLDQNDPFMLSQTALAEVTFTVLDRGPVEIDLVYEPGSQRESNLITSRNQDILSTVVGTTLDVK